MKRQVSGTSTFFRRTHENPGVADTVDREASQNGLELCCPVMIFLPGISPIPRTLPSWQALQRPSL